MQVFKNWLSISENRSSIQSDQLSFIVNELDTNRIAIRASNRFAITYGLLAQVTPQPQIIKHDSVKFIYLFPPSQLFRCLA